MILQTHSRMCQTHVCEGTTHTHNKAYTYFTSISLLSGCWCVVEGSPPEQGVFVKGVLRFGIPKAGPSTQKANTCDMCGPVLKDILYLAEHHGRHPRHKPYKGEACGRGVWLTVNFHQYQKEHGGEKTFTCKEFDKDALESHDFLQHQAIHSEVKSCRSTGHKKALPTISNGQQGKGVHTAQKPFK